MTKKEVEKKLKSLAKKAQKIYLEYLDSLGEEGNEIGKEEGYLSITIWRNSINVVSTRDKSELKRKNQIRFWEYR